MCYDQGMVAKTWSNIDELREWLTAVAIPTVAWGKNGAKTIEDLWQEVITGETILQDNPPQRQVQVVKMVIRRGNQVLIEAAQELADGQMRQRDILPAEKMKTGEEVETAVLRGLREELGIAPENVTILASRYQEKKSIKDSPSYPGLPTRYTIYSLAVQVKGLPESDFWHDNEAHKQGDPVKRHHWSWQIWAPTTPSTSYGSGIEYSD